MNYGLSEAGWKRLEGLMIGYRFFQESRRWPSDVEIEALRQIARIRPGLEHGKKLEDIIKEYRIIKSDSEKG